MKQLVRTFALVFVAAFALMILASYLNKSQGYSGGNTLTIYNWGDYIDLISSRNLRKNPA